MATTVTSESAVAGTPAAGDAPRTTAGLVLLLIVAIELLLLYAPTMSWLYARWTMSVWNNAHGFLIPPAVVYFAWQELRPIRALPSEASPWGFAFLVPAIAAHVLDTGINTQILSAASICLALPGLSLLFLGTTRTKAIAFPLAFSVFMVPIPLAMTEGIHLVGRQVATFFSSYALPLLGVTVYAEGTSLHMSNGTLFIGDGCSGFSTVYAAVAVAALTAYACDNWRGRILSLGLAVPIAIASNALRVTLLGLLVQWRGLQILETWVHPASGMLTFALSLPVIFWLGAPSRAEARS